MTGVAYLIDDRSVIVTGRPPQRGLQNMMIPISKAKAKLSELVRHSEDEDVVVMNHATPAAILVGAARYDGLLEEIEELRDRLSVHECAGVTIGLGDLTAELGLTEEVATEAAKRVGGRR